jgi:hypothetical protein
MQFFTKQYICSDCKPRAENIGRASFYVRLVTYSFMLGGLSGATINAMDTKDPLPIDFNNAIFNDVLPEIFEKFTPQELTNIELISKRFQELVCKAIFKNVPGVKQEEQHHTLRISHLCVHPNTKLLKEELKKYAITIANVPLKDIMTGTKYPRSKFNALVILGQMPGGEKYKSQFIELYETIYPEVKQQKLDASKTTISRKKTMRQDTPTLKQLDPEYKSSTRKVEYSSIHYDAGYMEFYEQFKHELALNSTQKQVPPLHTAGLEKPSSPMVTDENKLIDKQNTKDITAIKEKKIKKTINKDDTKDKKKKDKGGKKDKKRKDAKDKDVKDKDDTKDKKRTDAKDKDDNTDDFEGKTKKK